MPKVRLVSTAEVAQRLGCDVRTVHRWAAEGRLPAFAKLPGARGALVFDEDDVSAMERELASTCRCRCHRPAERRAAS